MTEMSKSLSSFISVQSDVLCLYVAKNTPSYSFQGIIFYLRRMDTLLILPFCGTCFYCMWWTIFASRVKI